MHLYMAFRLGAQELIQVETRKLFSSIQCCQSATQRYVSE